MPRAGCGPRSGPGLHCTADQVPPPCLDHWAVVHGAAPVHHDIPDIALLRYRGTAALARPLAPAL